MLVRLLFATMLVLLPLKVDAIALLLALLLCVVVVLLENQLRLVDLDALELLCLSSPAKMLMSLPAFTPNAPPACTVAALALMSLPALSVRLLVVVMLLPTSLLLDDRL